MLKKGVHSVLVGVMALVLLFGTTPKEFIHLFAGHHDTVHHEHAPGEFSFEGEHHHCDFLSYDLPAFDNDIRLPYLPVVATRYYRAYATAEVRITHGDVVQVSSRGPPAVAA